MKIVKIRATKFRTLEDISLDFSKEFCTISGKNNSGKSCVIKLLLNLFYRYSSRPWMEDENLFDYKEDKTQWVKDEADVVVDYFLELGKKDDAALISFVDKYKTIEASAESICLQIQIKLTKDDDLQVQVKVDSSELDDPKGGREIYEKIRNSNLLFVHNSTNHEDNFYRYGRGRRRTLYDVFLSDEEQKELKEASKRVHNKINKFGKEHREELGGLLGRLTEKYDVEFSSLEGSFTRHIPFSINLKDKNVEVPLSDWGSGTQNRTFIMMSILQATRIKTRDPELERITPIVIIEEPESFLHPSAQAEFGRLLRDLAHEVGIQIIVTTHSPYMLNQKEPASNILLCRNVSRGKVLESFIVDTSGANWMAPFSEHLGITPVEFQKWKPVFSSYESKVLLVEGEIDKEYIEYINSNELCSQKLLSDIEIVPYGGKDALKNTKLVSFVLSKFDRVFVTYDLDAESSCKSALSRLDLKEGRDFIPIGINKPGRDAIEGLLPDRVLSAVNSSETDLIMQLGSAKSDERKSAKNSLKRKYLEKFKEANDYSSEEMKLFSKLIKDVNKSMDTTSRSTQRR